MVGNLKTKILNFVDVMKVFTMIRIHSDILVKEDSDILFLLKEFIAKVSPNDYLDFLYIFFEKKQLEKIEAKDLIDLILLKFKESKLDLIFNRLELEGL